MGLLLLKEGSALGTALTTIAGSITTQLNEVIPIAVPVVGIGLAVVLGIKLFKRIVNKA